MHHTQKKKYLGMKDAGLTAEELKEEMLANEIPAEEVEAFIAEAFEGSANESEQPEPEEKKGKKPAPTPKNTEPEEGKTPIYEEWKMQKTADGLEKAKLIKTVKLHDDRAERLNAHAENRLIKYFKKQ